MPQIARTILPRIRKSIEERGWWGSIRRSFLLPGHLVREYRDSRSLHPTKSGDSFDQDYGVDTDGEFGGWTYLSDLKIPSANWIRGNNYLPIDPGRFRAAVSTLAIKFEDFIFVDFGSGKGRALLLASEYPFKRIIGVEFSPELHAIAQTNIRKYRSLKFPVQKAQAQTGQAQAGQALAGEASSAPPPPMESVCMDFVDFSLPDEPSVYFLFDPCDEYVLGRLLSRIGDSLAAHPRHLRLIYLAPTLARERLLDSMKFLTRAVRNTEHNFCIYAAG
jgi:SAM-dependent methyltransferase